MEYNKQLFRKTLSVLICLISLPALTMHAQTRNLFEWTDGEIVPNNAFITLDNKNGVPDNVQVHTYEQIDVHYNNKQYIVAIRGTQESASGKFFDCFSILNSSGEDLLTYWGYDALFTVDFLTNNKCEDYFIQIPLNEESFALVFAGALYDYCDEAGEIVIAVVNGNDAKIVYSGHAFAYNYTPAPDFSIEFVDNIRFVDSINELFDDTGRPTTTAAMLARHNRYRIWRDGSMLKFEALRNDFETFLMQFGSFGREQIGKHFFTVRMKRATEKFSPEIDKYKYSSFIPHDERCNCDRDELYYRPCYHVETENFHMIAIEAACDRPTNGHPFVSNILVTYNKNGDIIDYETIGNIGDTLYCNIDESKGFSELAYTQYSFYDTEKVYSGMCDVAVYKIVINDNGKIDRTMIKNYSDKITIVIM